MTRLSWYFHRTAERLSPLNWLILLFLLTIVVILKQLWPMSSQAVSQPETIAPAQLPSEALPSPSLPAPILFMQQAPPVTKVTDAIAALAVLAEAHQIPIREVGYQDVIRPDSDLLAYQINFSVEADYQRLRAFIADTLAELPYLALQQLTIQRDEISSQQLRGDMQFTRYMRRGS